MTRIPPISPNQAGLLIKLSYWYAKRLFGEVPEPFAVAANHPKLFVASAIAETLAGKVSTALPANVRGLAVYRVAWSSVDDRLLVVYGLWQHAAAVRWSRP